MSTHRRPKQSITESEAANARSIAQRAARNGPLRRLANVVLLISATGLYVFQPWIPAVCPTRRLFHVPCPSCGFTRAAKCLMHLDLAGATRVHPLWWCVFPYLAIVGALEVITYVRTGVSARWAERPVFKWTGLALVGLLVAVWLSRWAGAFGGPVPID